MGVEWDRRKAQVKGKRGAVVPASPGKTQITIRLDGDLLAWFRTQVHAAGGGNYQSLINRALREFMVVQREPLERTMRRVIREEFAGYRATAKPRPRGKLIGNVPRR